MPKWRGTLQKYWAAAGAYWTNVYWIDAVDIITAGNVLGNIKTAELPLYTSGIVITNGRVDDAIQDTDVYLTLPYNNAGTRAGPTSEIAPLWVTSRVDFGVSGMGRPSRKYLRGTLWEEDFSYNALSAGQLARLNTYGAAIVAQAVVDPDGQDLISYAPWNAPQMRQLRRGKKRRVIPLSPL